MLFDSTVRRELARGFGATLVVILTIVLTMFLIRTLGQAASGAVAPQDVVLLLGYVALGHLPTMLALSLFIAIVVTLGRMYRDSEMAIWFASGVQPVALRAAGAAHQLAGAAGGRRCCCCSSGPGATATAPSCATATSSARDLSRVTPGRVPDLARRQPRLLHRARQRPTASTRATSSS